MIEPEQYPTVNILTERNTNMPYFTMDELFIEATEGQRTVSQRQVHTSTPHGLVVVYWRHTWLY